MNKTLKELIQYHIPKEKGYVSHSSLGTVKKLLMGKTLFYGDEKFLRFGSEMHRRILEPHIKQEFKFEGEDEEKIQAMTDSALRHGRLLQDHIVSEKEVLEFGIIAGVKVKLFADMLKRGVFAADLKSTSTTSEEAFIESARKYDYFRQAWIYMTVLQVPEFRFYAIPKKSPHKIFVMNPMDFPEEMAKAKAETLMLIDVVKQNADFDYVKPIKIDNVKSKTVMKNNNVKSVTLQTRVHPNLRSAIKAVAKERGVGLSEMVRILLEKNL